MPGLEKIDELNKDFRELLVCTPFFSLVYMCVCVCVSPSLSLSLSLSLILTHTRSHSLTHSLPPLTNLLTLSQKY